MIRIFIDPSKCQGCLNCSIACMNANRDDSGTIYDLDLESKDNISRNFIYQNDSKYYPIFCRHCDIPDCVSSCVSGALQKNPDTGFVEYDKDKCVACFTCVMSCRYGLPRPNKDNTYVLRCSFCQDTKEGSPQCVSACPTSAISIREVK